jgi:hypothetical protein
MERLQFAIEEMFESSGATGGVATVVYDQQVILSVPWGNTRLANSGNNVTADTVFRIGRCVATQKIPARIFVVCVCVCV